MRFYVLALLFQHLVHLYCCWAQINGKKKKTFLFRTFLLLFIIGVWVCVFFC